MVYLIGLVIADSDYDYDSEGHWTAGIEQRFRTRPFMCDVD